MKSQRNRIGRIVSGFALAALWPICLCGCGNQMMRQPSFRALASPRAALPSDAVPVAAALTPYDARPIVTSSAGGSNRAIAARLSLLDTRIVDPPLPPPNLSDNARNQPSPKSVDRIGDPLPSGPWIISAGHDLFLNRCVQCHNSSGYGYGPVGEYLLPHPPDLASPLVQRNTNGALFWRISMGQGKMPGFRRWMDAAQRWELVGFVRSLKDAPAGVRASDTLDAPYPVYGEPQFESGGLTEPYKVLPADPDIQRNIRATHFYQWEHDGKDGP